MAYPHLGGEERGLLMGRMVRDAAAALKVAEIGHVDTHPVATTKPATFTGTPGGGVDAMRGMIGF